MIKLLIVDDELIIRQGIRYSINWKALDVEVIGEADNVDSALEQMRHCYPDIVLCDIRMPGRSGLELIAEAKETFPETHFILISAYDDREYMLDAIRNGVDDYLLKPIYARQLTDAISKIGKSITLQRKTQKMSLANQRLLFNNLDTLRSVYAEDMLTGKIGGDALGEGLSALSISLNGPGYVLMMAEKNSDFVWETIQTINERFRDYAPVILPGIKYDLLYVFLNVPQSVAPDIDALSAFLGRELDAFVVASPLCGDLSACCGYFHQMREVLSRSMWYGGSVTADKADAVYPEFPADAVNSARNDILEAFRNTRSEAEIKTIFEAFLSLLADSKCRNSEYQLTMDELLQSVRLLLNTREDAAADGDCSATCSPEGARREFHKLSDQLNQPRYLYRNTLCGRIISHIEDHYAETISLETVANDLFLSPYYIAHLLKEKTNRSFLDWLHYIRIEKAKEMLCTTDLSVQSISSAVGYNSYKSFCKHFFECTNATATQFRQQEGIE